MTTVTVDKRKIRSVWMVSREYDGLAGAGGVKDVCRQLAEALVEHGGCAVRVIIPRYGFMEPRTLGFKPLSLPGRQQVTPCPGSFGTGPLTWT